MLNFKISPTSIQIKLGDILKAKSGHFERLWFPVNWHSSIVSVGENRIVMVIHAALFFSWPQQQLEATHILPLETL